MFIIRNQQIKAFVPPLRKAFIDNLKPLLEVDYPYDVYILGNEDFYKALNKLIDEGALWGIYTERELAKFIYFNFELGFSFIKKEEFVELKLILADKSISIFERVDKVGEIIFG